MRSNRSQDIRKRKKKEKKNDMIISRRIENFDSVIRGEIEKGARGKERRKKSRG